MSSSFGGPPQSRAARAARFAADAAVGAPPLPERRFAHPVAPNAIWRTDPEEKLLSFLRRRLAGGEGLSEAQLGALSRMGVSLEQLEEEAAALAPPAPAVYAEAAGKRRRSSLGGAPPPSRAASSGGLLTVATSAASGGLSSMTASSIGGEAPLVTPVAASASSAASSTAEGALRAAQLRKRLEVIDGKLRKGAVLSEKWLLRVDMRPAIWEELAALRAQPRWGPGWGATVPPEVLAAVRGDVSTAQALKDAL